MKLVIILVFYMGSFSQLQAANQCNSKSVKSVNDTIECVADAKNIDPNLDIITKCGEREEVSLGLSCRAEDETISHCGESIEYPLFCFNGKLIIDEGSSSNKTMKRFLCGELKFPVEPFSLSFGTCVSENDLADELKGLKYSEKVSCFCRPDSQNEEVFAWNCFNKKPL